MKYRWICGYCFEQLRFPLCGMNVLDHEHFSTSTNCKKWHEQRKIDDEKEGMASFMLSWGPVE